jgi:hypothetical protein
VPGIVGWLEPDGGRGAFSGMTFGLATQLRIRVKGASGRTLVAGWWRKVPERAGEEESVKERLRR